MNAEFRMITDISAVAPKELKFNYDELKTALSDGLERYRTMVVTEDAISDAKADKARLNALAKNISSYRISVKKALMEKYDNDFKPKCDELEGMVKDASGNIDVQVRAFEDAQKAEKIARIRATYFEQHNGEEAARYIPWESVFDKRWENKGFKEEDAGRAIGERFKTVADDLATIRTLDQRDVPYLLDFYKFCMSIRAVIQKSNELKERRAAEAERIRREEERRAAEDAAKAAAEAEKAARAREEQEAREARENAASALATASADGDAETIFEEESRPSDDDIFSVVFRASGTKEALLLLSKFCAENGITIARV